MNNFFSNHVGNIAVVASCLLFAVAILWLVDRPAVNACKQTPACYAKISPVYEGETREGGGWRAP